jgi:hypothetical protein
MISTRDLKELRSNAYRDEYLQDWNVSVDHNTMDLHDHNGMVRRVKRGEPKVTMEFRGHPVTLVEAEHGKKIISIWMPGEAHRTEPLLSETMPADLFYEEGKKALMDASNRSMMFQQGQLGLTEAFCVAWAEKNYRVILAAEDKRERDRYAFFDPFADPNDPIEVEDFRGADGRRYSRLKPNKKAEERRVLAEMEDLPGFGSF